MKQPKINRSAFSGIRGSTSSWFRLSMILGAGVLTYLKFASHSRYVVEIFHQGGHTASTVPGKDLEEVAFIHPTNHHALPPIYWINLDISVARRIAMQDMFMSLGITDTHRVSAFDINTTLELWHTDRMVFHENVTLEERDGRPSNKKHLENIYEYPEAACLMSHLQAIKTAFQAGHDQVLILEDDALLSSNFRNQWKPYVDRAPQDWKILQFATNNPNVVKQGVNLVDPFITWQPYHWSTRAYLINRAGMQTLMDKIYDSSATGQDLWRITDVPMVVADEVLYYVIGDAYTSTGLWVDSLSFGSTIQSKNAHSNLTTLIGEATNRNIMIALDEEVFDESLLVLMSVRIHDLEEMTRELRWIRQDSHAVCQMHKTCVWEINMVLTDASLKEAFHQEETKMPPNVHLHSKVSSKPFNKFSYIRAFVEEMLDYDLVLFKDNDQRLNGFPWRTFVKQKADASVSGPLRQNMDEALLWRHAYPKRQYFQFHAAEAWTEDWNTAWSSNLFAKVTPTEVPMLEMYFVLFNAKFANYFFDTILTSDFIKQRSAWGPDLLWCSAAKEWDDKHPSCYLVPVSSNHEDTRQIYKNTTEHKEGGEKMVEIFKSNPTFKKWMEVPSNWKYVIGGQLLWQIERRCRKLLRLRMIYPFDLSSCPVKLREMVMESKKKAIRPSSGGAEGANKQKESDDMNKHVAEKINPWLQMFGGNRTGLQNRTRVAELVETLKASRNVSSSLGITNRNPILYDKERQRKSLNSFQARLAELKRSRKERLANEENEETNGTGARSPESNFLL